MGVVCLLGDSYSTEGDYGAEEEGGDWGGVNERTREEEKDLTFHLTLCDAAISQPHLSMF